MDTKKIPLIVFCGMDGSGKTTLAKKLVQFFEELGLECEFNHGHKYTVSQDSFGLSEARVNKLRHLFRLLVPLAFVDNLFTFY